MSGRTALTAACALFAAVWIFSAPGFAADEAPRIAKEEVKTLLSDPNVAILDARITPDWKKSDRKIKGAVRVDPLDVGAWAGNYTKDKKIIVYCAWAEEATSASVVLNLRERGYTNVFALKGGWNGWIEAGYPTEPK